MKFATTILFFVSVSFGSAAQATVFKCVDAHGGVTYTNDRSLGRGCTPLNPDLPVSSIPSPSSRPAATPPPTSAPANGFPRVSPDAQRARDDTRRQILESELAAEQAALNDAQSALAENAARDASDGAIESQQLAESLQPYQDQIELHERNIEALRRELRGLR